MIKISALGAKDIAPLHLKDEVGEPMFYEVSDGEKPVQKPVQIHVYGPGSEAYRQAQLRANRRVMALAKKGSRALENRTPDERARDAADLLADITAHVDGIDLEGQPLREGMHTLYANPRCGWIAEQVTAFASDWANFPGSAPKA